MIVFTNHCGYCKKYIGRKHDVMCKHGSNNIVERSHCHYEVKAKQQIIKNKYLEVSNG